MLRVLALCLVLAAPVLAQDIVVIGEVHDNPAHHQAQARLVAELLPTALVFEMLTGEQAAQATAELRSDQAALAAALGWDGTGWPDFALYYPIFAAAPGAAVYGAALPREAAQAAADLPATTSFGPDAAAYGLAEPLPDADQTAREALQAEAHCGALPDEVLPKMVALQRLRDAMLARAALRALAAHGPPVVVITGNGHARRDWGAPAAMLRAVPEVTVFAIGQGERGAAPEGVFDDVLDAAPIERDDPCAAFR